MKTTCEQGDLGKGIALVNHAASKGTSGPPITTTIRIQAEPDSHRLRLDATNTSIGITAWIPVATLEETGTVAVPARLTTELISALSPGTLRVTVDAHEKVQLKGTSGIVNIHGVDAEEFPFMPQRKTSAKPTLLKATQLKEAIREVFTAIDETMARNEVFGSMLIRIKEGQITFLAADGYGRLSFRTLPLATENALVRDILIPGNTLRELMAILPNDGMIELSLTPSANQVIFSSEWMMLTSILTSGTFPDYLKAFPEERLTRVTVKTAELREIVKLTVPFAKANHDAGHITIRGSKGMEPGTLTMEADAADVGDNCNSISGVVEGQDQIDLVFDITYLARILTVVNTPEVRLEIGETRAPFCVVRPVGEYSCTHTLASMASSSRVQQTQTEGQ